MSSAHYAQSNGKVESAVKTCKRLMEKAIEDREDPHLALLAWRNTPAEQLGQSPAQIMFGRRTRTHLPMAQKLLSSAHDTAAHNALQKAKERQAAHYDRTAKEKQTLNVGDTVRTRWDKRQPWTKAEVTKVFPHRSYELRYQDGTVRRRTSKHVRFSPEPPLVIRDEIDTDSPSRQSPASAPSTRRTASTTINMPPPHQPRHETDEPRFTRSGRQIRRPPKLKDFVCYSSSRR